MDPHYVYAEQPLGDEDTRVLKHGDTFAIFNHYGGIEKKGLAEQGIYHQGTRFLSYFSLFVNGSRPLFLSSTIRKDNAALTVDLTNPDLVLSPEHTVVRGSLHIQRCLFLWNGVAYEEVRVVNYATIPVDSKLTYYFEADFADIFEVRGTHRRERGDFLGQATDGNRVSLSYRGLDGVVRRLHLGLSQPATAIRQNELEFQLMLGPQEERVYVLTMECDIEPRSQPALPFHEAYRLASSSYRESKKGAALVETSHEQFDEWMDRSEADLHMMLTETPYGRYPYAGVPWFSTAFGRDGIITALECLWFFPRMARDVLAFLAATQATDTNPERDSQPGKILHEMRGGEMAALGEIPFGRYYGSVDSTPLFVMLAGAYFDRTGDFPFIEKIWPNIQAALAWLRNDGDADRDGFVEYYRKSPQGLVHQGWKDSGDSIFHQDGSSAQGPIALCEVQGYVYAAKRYASRMALARGDTELGIVLGEEAELLRERFEKSFWCEEISTYALALDGDKRPCRVRTSNAGHCLFAGIASTDRAERVAQTLLGDELFSGWGIRTLSSTEKRFNPMSYHNGSVWPHDNALVARGLSHYHIRRGAMKVFDAIFHAGLYVNLHRMPELYCGFRRRPGEGPTLYPVACSPQAWSAAAVFSLLESTLGLQIEAFPKKRVAFFHPELPGFLDEVKIRNLQVGDASVDILLRRHNEDTGVNVLERTGEVEVNVIK